MSAVSTVPGFRSDDARRRYVAAYDRVLTASPVPLTEHDIETPYGRTHVLTAGDPGHPPLVALHGKAVSSTMWIPLLDTLTASHRVFLLDTIGDINKSVATRVLHDGDDVARWLDALFRDLAVEGAALVGMSYGAWMGTTYAMARPGSSRAAGHPQPRGRVRGSATGLDGSCGLREPDPASPGDPARLHGDDVHRRDGRAARGQRARSGHRPVRRWSHGISQQHPRGTTAYVPGRGAGRADDAGARRHRRRGNRLRWSAISRNRAPAVACRTRRGSSPMPTIASMPTNRTSSSDCCASF